LISRLEPNTGLSPFSIKVTQRTKGSFLTRHLFNPNIQRVIFGPSFFELAQSCLFIQKEYKMHFFRHSAT